MRPKLVPFHYADQITGRIDQSGGGRLSYIDLGTDSRWFDTLAIVEIPAGGSDGMRVYPGGEAGTAETWYIIAEGQGDLVSPDGKTTRVRPYDGIWFGPGSAGELRASAGTAMRWLVVSSDGGKATPFSATGGRGASTRVAVPNAAASPVYFDRRWVAPRQWPANRLGATAKPWWFFTVDDYSKWYHSACISCIAPGGASTFHTHMEEYEGPYETFYIVLNGTALIRNEYEDRVFVGGPAGVYVPADASHQIINAGEGLLWYLTLSSRGGNPLTLDVYNTPSGTDRPGYLEEYNRIIRQRGINGLPVP